MQFIDSLTGYACGYGGFLIKTTDSGNQWIEKQVPDDGLIVDLFFLNEEIGWILYNGTDNLYRTTDGGDSWYFISNFQSRHASIIYFLDEQNGFAGGYTGGLGYMLKTTDGGFDWEDETEVNECSSIYFLNHDTGFVGSTNIIYKTNDGGNTWTTIGIDYAVFTPWDIFAYNQNNIYLIGYGTDIYGNNHFVYLNTSNGGTTWDTLSFKNSLTDIYFKSPSNGFICEDKILRTTNRGASWDTTNFSADEFCFVGNKSWSYYYNTVSFSENEWSSSTPQIKSVFTGFINDGFAIDSEKVFACGSNGSILRTLDGGKHWDKPYSSSANIWMNGITAKNGEIWSVGDNGKVVFSKDDGTTWTEKTIDDSYLSDITFLSDGTGFISCSLGSVGALFTSVDGGETWGLLEEFMDVTNLNKIKFSTGDLGWATGYPRAIFRTTDRGNSWENVVDSVYAPASIAVSGDTAWFSYGNKILRTTDAGNTWESFNVFEGGTGSTKTDIDFINSKIGYECTYDSRVLKTTNGGETWNEENYPKGVDNFALNFVNEEKGWVFGSPGIIIMRNPYFVSINNNSYMGSDKFILLQNYPNPFNPTTIIEFELPERTNVSLKIYDVLGKEIKSLIKNEIRNQGKYEVNFNGKDLASGVYIYRLRTDEFSISKKMLLLK
jgi:photosystem II stability/assembly factor-like uncharacterized protein